MKPRPLSLRSYPPICDCGDPPEVHRPDADGGSPCEFCACGNYEPQGRWGG